MGAGIISAGVFTVGAGLGFVVAPFTGGASLGLVLGGFGLSASVGSAAKVVIKAGDAYFGGRKYDSLGYDLATGAADGVFAPFTAGLGGATAKKVGTICVKKGMTAAKARVAAKVANVAGMSAGGAIDGGTYSAAAYVTGDAENKNFVDGAKEVGKGATVGAVAGPVVGEAFHGLGKLCSKGVSAVKKIFGKSGSGSAGSAAKPGSASGAAASQSKTASCISIDDFKKAGNTFKNGKAVTPDGKAFEGTVGQLTGKTENGVDCYSKSTYKNGVRETLERYEGDKFVSSVKYEYDQATGKVAKIIGTDAATGNKVNKAFGYDQNGKMSYILKTDKDGKDLGRTDFIFGKDGKLWDRADFDEGGNVLNHYRLDNEQFLQMIKDGKCVSEKMYSSDVKYLNRWFSETEISGFRNGIEFKAYKSCSCFETIVAKDGSKNVMKISGTPNGEKVLTSYELSSPVKGIEDIQNIPDWAQMGKSSIGSSTQRQ